jgi:hypothetical protein
MKIQKPGENGSRSRFLRGLVALLSGIFAPLRPCVRLRAIFFPLSAKKNIYERTHFETPQDKLHSVSCILASGFFFCPIPQSALHNPHFFLPIRLKPAIEIMKHKYSRLMRLSPLGRARDLAQIEPLSKFPFSSPAFQLSYSARIRILKSTVW